jgi:hypothetical protein
MDLWTDINFDKQNRALGAKPRDTRLGQHLNVLEESISPIPRNQWDGLIESVDEDESGLDSLVVEIKNQKQESSCASNATAQGGQIVQGAQYGLLNVVLLSAISLYNRVRGGRDAGSTIYENLEESAARGFVPLDTPTNREAFGDIVMPATGLNAAFPANWEPTGKMFAATEWYDIGSFDGFVTAILRGFPVVYGRQGHAICGCRVVKQNGVLKIKYANSWGVWGDKGFGYDTEGMLSSAIPSYGAFALRSMVVPRRVAEAMGATRSKRAA